MTTLILRIGAAAPNFGGVKRLATAFGNFVAALMEAKQMAREAQRRFPFVVE
jgi:hypothetical protein